MLLCISGHHPISGHHFDLISATAHRLFIKFYFLPQRYCQQIDQSFFPFQIILYHFESHFERIENKEYNLCKAHKTTH